LRSRELTEEELILLLSREAGEEGSENDLIKRFREKYRDQSGLIAKASQGDSKALRRLRWLCGLKVITKMGVWEPPKG
jgi:hypothetical protein